MTTKIRSQEIEERRLMLMAAAAQWEVDLGVTEKDRFETPWAPRAEALVSIDIVATGVQGTALS